MHKRLLVAEKEEMDEAVRAAAKRAPARHMSPLAVWFKQALARDVKQQTLLVIECLDDLRERAAARVGAACAALEEVPPKEDPCVLCNAAVPVQLGSCQ